MASQEEIERWFKACESDASVATVRQMLADGFDPDTRDLVNRNGLRRAAEYSHYGIVVQVAETLIQALQEKYKDKPRALVDALIKGPTCQVTADVFCDSDQHIKNKIREAIADARVRSKAPDQNTFLDRLNTHNAKNWEQGY